MIENERSSRDAEAAEETQALTLVRTIDRSLDDPGRQELLTWARQLLEIRERSVSPIRKAKLALDATTGSRAVRIMLSATGKSLKKVAWDDRGWAVRLGLGTGAVAAATVGGQGAGIAALGGAIGVPLWVVLGAGATFAGALIDELQSSLSRARGTPADSEAGVAMAETAEIQDAEWEFVDRDDEAGALPRNTIVLPGDVHDSEADPGSKSSLWEAFKSRVPEALKRSTTSAPWVIAVDWSGAIRGAEKKIVLSEISGEDGMLVRIEDGRTRTQLITHLIELAEVQPNIVVGLDFAFSFPAWFVRSRGLDSVREVWDLVEEEGEEWLAECPAPFYGAKGKKRPDDLTATKAFRLTERQVSEESGVNAKTVFQLAGAGHVGTGSIRGMPFLKRLSGAGFSIWPFDPPEPPVVVEIYPRVLSGPVNKSDPKERLAKLEELAPEQEEQKLELAAESDDAFDATISALVMIDHAEAILDLDPVREGDERLEGRIWHPDLHEAADA